MFVVLWAFEVPPENENPFEAHYGPGGPWHDLYRRSQAYLGSELTKDEITGRYMTIDRWNSHEEYFRWKGDHSETYKTLDRRDADLTNDDGLVGFLHRVSSGESQQ